MKIYNAFGITPTNSFSSAGSDYYIPNLDSEKKINLAFKAFEKSYHKTKEEIDRIAKLFKVLYEDHADQYANLTMLFLSLYDRDLKTFNSNEGLEQEIVIFLNNFVVYDEKKKVVGIKLRLHDTLFVNSGLKIALETVFDVNGPRNEETIQKLKSVGVGIGGLYVNKSGKGNAGFDVRACLVDEDYSGYVHLSLGYEKDLLDDGQNIVYCGDKLTQMMLIPIFHTQYEEISESEYDKLMENSERGNSGFGSQDIKH